MPRGLKAKGPQRGPTAFRQKSRGISVCFQPVGHILHNICPKVGAKHQSFGAQRVSCPKGLFSYPPLRAPLGQLIVLCSLPRRGKSKAGPTLAFSLPFGQAQRGSAHWLCQQPILARLPRCSPAPKGAVCAPRINWRSQQTTRRTKKRNDPRRGNPEGKKKMPGG